MITKRQALIEAAFQRSDELSPSSAETELREAVASTLAMLEKGELRVAEKIAGEWVVHPWLKKAVLLSLRLNDNKLTESGATRCWDKVPTKYAHYTAADFQRDGIRIVPGAVVRQGAYVGKGTLLMPCFVDTGAYVDEGSRVDAWASVGACAQLGKNVHLCDGAGLGGVLEPLQAKPTIIEDNCYIGARSEIAEGVVIKEGSVIAMGVFIDQSTRIYDRETGETHYGHVPAGSVVVSGTLPSKCGTYSLYAAIIVKKVDAETRAKLGINALLRGII